MLTVAESEITGCGWADVAVGSFQYDLYIEVGNAPGAVYADWISSVARAPVKGQRQIRVSREEVNIMVLANLIRVNRENSRPLYVKAGSLKIRLKVILEIESMRPWAAWEFPAERRRLW